MAKAIWSKHNLVRGLALLGKYGEQRGTVKQMTYDGDTVFVEADGNISLRFLGIDTPEKSLIYPGTERFKSIYPYFTDYLTDPFSGAYDDSARYKKELGDGLVGYLKKKLGPTCAVNHWDWADLSEDKLEYFIQHDVDRVGGIENYRFFMAFAYEIMDGYGRFLCYLHQDLPPEERGGASYNEKILQAGMAMPYFIWPNINPFRKEPSIKDAIPAPKDFKSYVDGDSRLYLARQFVKNARNRNCGLFDRKNPLLLEPFELRFLAKRKPPKRYVIDMTKAEPKLLRPTNYYLVPNVEDRLFVNDIHMPLFKSKGYPVESSDTV